LLSCRVLRVSERAVLVRSQLSQQLTAYQEISRLHRQAATREREDQDLVYLIAREQSPVYIAAHAKAMGLIPADPSTVIVLVVPHLKTIPPADQHMQP